MPTAIITGAAKGIGAAIARRLAKEGYRLALCYRTSKDRALALADELASDGVFVVPYYMDVRSEENIKEVFDSVIKTFGTLDLVVNNAGIQLQKMVQDMSLAEWQEMVDVVLTSVFLTAREAVPKMLGKGGCIINIGSMWGEVGAAMESAYSAAKGGVFAFTKAMAKELAPSRIRVNAVSLGVIDTDMTAVLGRATIDRLKDETPLGRIGSVSDVAEAVAFLASENAGFITGEILRINGGFVI